MTQHSRRGRARAPQRWAHAGVATLLAACNVGEFRTYLPDGAVAPYPEVVTLVENRVIDFPKEDEGTLRGIGKRFSLDVPREAIAVGVMIQGSLSGAYRVGEWMDDNQKQLTFFNEEILNEFVCTECLNPTYSTPIVHAAMAPNNDDGRFSPGTHRLVAIGERYTVDVLEEANLIFVKHTGMPIGGSARITALAKVTNGLPERGQLDLNLHFTGAQGWTAANAATNPGVQRALSRVAEIYRPIGLSIRSVSYFDADPELEIIEDPGTPDVDSDLHRLRREGTEARGVNVFFVGQMTFGPLGIASGIPGPWVNGTPGSGVTVALDLHVEEELLNATEVGDTLAHEIGHELGLFHTFQFGGNTDPVDDTDESCDWLMYFSATCVSGGDSVGTRISAEQARVMRRNMHVTHDVEDAPLPGEGGVL